MTINQLESILRAIIETGGGETDAVISCGGKKVELLGANPFLFDDQWNWTLYGDIKDA